MEQLRKAKNLLKNALRDSADVVENFKAEGRAETEVETETNSESGKVRFSYKGKTHSGIRKYKSDFPADMSQEKRVELFKERISTIFNLGMVKLKTDVKKIEVKGDRFTVQKNIYGDEVARDSEKEAKVNSLYDLADILATSKFESIEKETSYADSSIPPKNNAHKEVKYWYKFVNTIFFDGTMYHVTFNIRDKGKEQYQYLIEFRESKKKTNSASNTVKSDLLRTAESSHNDTVPQKSDSVNTYSMQENEKDVSKNEKNVTKKGENVRNSVKMEDVLRQNETLKKAYVMAKNEIWQLKHGKAEYKKGKLVKAAKAILNEFDFAYDGEAFSNRFEGLAEDIGKIVSGKMDIETFRSKTQELARDVINAGLKTDSAAYQESKELRDYLRTTAVSLNEDARLEMGDEYESIRKRTFGRLRLVKDGGTPMDVYYRELAERFPMYFGTETERGDGERLKKLTSVLDNLQSLNSNPYGDYIDEAVEWLSNMIIDRIYNEAFISGDVGDVNITVDMKAMRAEMADNLQETMARDREWREREQSKLQSQYEKKVRKYSEARQKTIKTQQIRLHVERLSKALIDPSERFAVHLI